MRNIFLIVVMALSIQVSMAENVDSTLPTELHCTGYFPTHECMTAQRDFYLRSPEQPLYITERINHFNSPEERMRRLLKPQFPLEQRYIMNDNRILPQEAYNPIEYSKQTRGPARAPAVKQFDYYQ